MCICLARWYRARRSVVHSQDDAANSVITICVAYMSLTKNTILVRSRLCMYITGDRRTVAARRGFVALIAHRHYLPFHAADFHPPYATNCTLRGTGTAEVRFGGVSRTKTLLYVLSLEFKSQSSKVPSRGILVDSAVVSERGGRERVSLGEM